MLAVSGLSGTTGLGSVVIIAPALIVVTGVSANGETEKVNVWGLVDDAQTANYSNVSTTQTASYSDVTDTQTPNWKEVA